MVIMTISVCVLAHNEERLIERTLGALEEACGDRAFRAHVIVNGSADRSAAIVHRLAREDRRIVGHELEIADKANAWNYYIHELALDAPAHCFLDGDIRPGRGSIQHLIEALENNPQAYAAAALPGSGRSKEPWSAELVKNHYLSGNLYALSDHAVALMRRRGIRLPVGAKGEDGLLSYLFLTDLQGGKDDTHTQRIVNPEDARFYFDSLSLSPADIRLYWRRLLRYSERSFQNQLLYALLKECGVAALPSYIREIYTEDRIRDLRPRNRLLYFVSDRLVLNKIRKGSLFPQAEEKKRQEA
ncbi:glycosyltransferase family A protein [Halorhodospira sp. 9628]|uniref:glycosyltransferase family A protein n=2 Tax=Halorhodospira TaxID=85108 RepID=UPI001EE8BFC1|nr:glycosyltransferase family 2 protein [Halorhodospira sp. 9628]MCG5542131.1 glycosyltransferase family 2 protein [Halorhodospira sp. 9628]